MGQPVIEIDSNKFQKSIIKDRCSGPNTIFKFYENVQHIAGSFHILLQPLDEVTQALGTCQLTPYNCLGYENVKEVISIALYLKLSGTDYFKEYPQAIAYINAASSTSNGFRLLYRILILELVHPQLH